jgi:aminomethyltransferase
MESLKRTPLYDAHLKQNAKMVSFAGWEMPIEYTGLVEEHQAVRQAAGVFDVSHMGEVTVEGPDALAFVDYLVSNDVYTLVDNQVLYTHMCYEHGGTVDDLLVYRMEENRILLVINAGNIDKDYEWIVSHRGNYNVELNNISDQMGEVAIQGPQAETILQKLTTFDLSGIKFFFCQENVVIAGVDCLVSRTGYTGEDGFEVYVKPDQTEKVWDAILLAGKPFGLLPTGLGCRDTLRFEASLPLYGNELSPEISPLEAGLGMFVKLEAGDFIGKAALVNQKQDGVAKKIVGFEMLEAGIPRHGYEVIKDGGVIGVVTTGYYSPTLEKNIGLALIQAEHAKLDSEFEIQIRKKTKSAKQISKRFYQKNYKK